MITLLLILFGAAVVGLICLCAQQWAEEHPAAAATLIITGLAVVGAFVWSAQAGGIALTIAFFVLIITMACSQGRRA